MQISNVTLPSTHPTGVMNGTGLPRTGKRPLWWAEKISIYPTDQGFMTCILVVVERRIRKNMSVKFELCLK